MIKIFIYLIWADTYRLFQRLSEITLILYCSFALLQVTEDGHDRHENRNPSVNKIQHSTPRGQGGSPRKTLGKLRVLFLQFRCSRLCFDTILKFVSKILDTEFEKYLNET